MDTFAISAAVKTVHKYKTRNPLDVIDSRSIKLRWFTRFEELLGYYLYCNHQEYIGINANATVEEQRSAAAHELGHALIDGPRAAAGNGFQDTRFYSTSNAKAEMRANTFAAEFLLSDDFVLERVGYYEFDEMRVEMERSLPGSCSAEYKSRKYYEMFQEFCYAHGDIGTARTIALETGIEEHLVDFKLRILSDNKGYKLPQPPELQSDFLKNVMKRHG